MDKNRDPGSGINILVRNTDGKYKYDLTYNFFLMLSNQSYCTKEDSKPDLS